MIRGLYRKKIYAKYKMVNLFTAAYVSEDEYDRIANNCNDAHTRSMRRVGSSGDRKHLCVKDSSNNLRYRENGGGHNPCKGFGVRFVGGGISGGGSPRDYDGKSTNFKDALFGLMCENVTVTDGNLKKWSGSDQMVTAGVKDSRTGVFKSLYDQAAFGVYTAVENTPGYCENINNLNKVIHKDGSTCYDMIKNAVEQKAKGIQYCKTNPKDPKCKCINVSGSDFIRYCKSNPTLPGCVELLKGIAEFESVGLTSASGLFGNADCIVPNICSGDVYEPLSPVPPCANKTAICNQILDLDNIKAAAGITAAQACNINFAAEQEKKDKVKQAEQAEQAERVEQAKLAQTSTTEDKKVSSRLPFGVNRLQAGLGGLSSFLLLICLIIVIILLVPEKNNK